jgi:glutamyl endopeptidase
LWTDAKFIYNENQNADWGLIKLSSSPGNSGGWFGYGWQASSLNATTVTVRGYPGDHPMEMWSDTGTIIASQPNRLRHDADTVGGESGSPMYTEGAMVIGIHTHGTDPAVWNEGTRITESLYNFFRVMSS